MIIIRDSLFRNSMHKNLTLDQVYEMLVQFLRQAPHNEYRLSIGTDSQVGAHETVFVTAIHLHKVGRGATGFFTTQFFPRPIKSLREKIYYETSKTLELAAWFTDEKMDKLVDCILTTMGRPGDIHFEFHLDVGTVGPTRELISEMVAMANGTGFEPKIKPESYAASCYANRYTKKIS
ncbi:MAG TPA: ribonuclease H-like YkuK family protein [Clostridia bacterium]|nr:ribonuclease H-like YkuK family protein [Clostridia bacterium]